MYRRNVSLSLSLTQYTQYRFTKYVCCSRCYHVCRIENSLTIAVNYHGSSLRLRWQPLAMKVNILIEHRNLPSVLLVAGEHSKQ